MSRDINNHPPGKRPYCAALLVLCAGFFITGHAAAELPGSAMLAYTCAGCHGANGSSVGPASPTIAGISVDYFIETMLAYKNATRPSTIMSRIAKGYSDEEIRLMAAFFAEQKIVRQPQDYDMKKAIRGRKLHKKYCNKCHEDGGALADDDAGILAGQWAPFLQFTFADFISGARPMPDSKKQQFDKLIKQQGADGVEQLIQFYASQH